MKNIYIITSAAYVDSELSAEFGLLPPAFLPLGNRRLFAHQHAVLRPHASKIILTIPESYVPDAVDLNIIESLGIELVKIPVDLTLGQSVVYAINMTASAGGPVSILHGDSFLPDLDYSQLDAISVAQTPPPPGYGWAWALPGTDGLRILTAEHLPDPGDMALTGFFSFSDGARFVQAVTRNRGNFVAGLADYAATKPLETLTSPHWFDFGHSSTYHSSRRRITTEREFNQLTNMGRAIIKSGRKTEKLRAEALWFEGLPPHLRVYTPGYLGRYGDENRFSYGLEYLHLPSLADLAVFGRLERNSWTRIFTACNEALSALAQVQGPQEGLDSARGLYLGKTLQRLEMLAESRNLSLTAPCRLDGRVLPSLRDIAERTAEMISNPTSSTLVHGDFCFSNLLYDMRADSIRMIDPRGTDANGAFSRFGDIRYDIGKLHHSAVGLYDHIIAENFRLTRAGDLEFTLELPVSRSIRTIREAFLENTFVGMSADQASAGAISTLLFLAMPPLHSDNPNRQMALLANGLRLFASLDKN